MNQRASTSASRDENSIAENFARFYEIYPRKRDRGDAEKAFNAALKKKTAPELIAACERYANWVKAQAKDKQFIPYAATWLRGEQWDDDLEGEAKPMIPVKLSEADKWRMRLRGYKERKFWSPFWGAEPGNGCDAPKSVLAEFGFAP
jgi:hypothetical protein